MGPELKPSPVIGVQSSKRLPEREATHFAGDAGFDLRWTPGMEQTDPGKGWGSILEPGDWWVLEVVTEGQTDSVTFGIIDRVTARWTVRNSTPIRLWSVAGRDFAGVLDDTEVWWCEFIADSSVAGSRMVDLLNGVLKGPPDTICQALVRGFIDPDSGPNGTWEFPRLMVPDYSQGLLSVVFPLIDEPIGLRHALDTTRHVMPVRGGGVIANQVTGSAYNLSALLGAWSNGVLNELFFDLRPAGKGVLAPSMVMRERAFPCFGEPASTSAWAQLPQAEVTWDHVVGGVDLSSSLQELITAYHLLQPTDPWGRRDQQLVNPPILHRRDAARYGLRRFQPQTRYLLLADGELASEEWKRWNWLLVSWYGLNRTLLSGQINLKGYFPELRIGRVLVLGGGPRPSQDPRRIEAYIEGVSVRWQPPPQGWTTTVTVTRGVVGGLPVYMQKLAAYWKGLEPANKNDPVPVAQTESLDPSDDSLSCYTGGTRLSLG